MIAEIRIKGACTEFAQEISAALSDGGPLPDPDVDYWFGRAVAQAESALGELRRRLGRAEEEC